jgi:hypothetical protein
MSTRHFVSGSSVILAGWLGATFLNEVPAQRYPKLDRKPDTASVQIENAPRLLVQDEERDGLPISLAH